MQQPPTTVWIEDDHGSSRNADFQTMIDDNNSVDSRGALGQFIERSTSAPPTSTTDNYHGDSLVGSKLLAHVNGSPTNLGSISSTFRPSSAIDSQATTPVTGNPNYNENPAPENDTFRAAFLSSMIDNSGRATAPAPGVFGQTSAGATSSKRAVGEKASATMGFGADASFDAAREIGFDPFQRSHSATPSSPAIGPPPGMPALETTPSNGSNIATRPNLQAHELVRRPASTGLLDSSSSSALRPAAKTLMDLIQEDYPPEETPTSNSSSPNQFKPQTPMEGQQLYGQGSLAGTAQNQYLSTNGNELLQVDQLQRQVQQLRLDSNGGNGQQIQQVGLMTTREPSPGIVIQPQSQSLHQVITQRYVPTGFEGRDSVNPDIPSSLYTVGQSQPQQQQPHQPQQQQQRQQHHQQLHRQQPQNVFVADGQIRQTQPGTVVTANGQQFFYQQQQQQQQQVEITPSTRLQAQVLPNGQTVYIQTPAPPPQQPTPSYTYTTIQYNPQTGQAVSEQTQQQQTRIVSSTAPTPMIRQSDGTLVPAISIQDANTGQVTYWPSSVVSQPQNQGGVVVVGDTSNAARVPQQVPLSPAPGVHLQQHSQGDHLLHQAQQQQRHTQQHHGQQHQQQQQHGSHQYGRGGREKGGGAIPANGRARRGGGNHSRRAEPKGHTSSSPLLEEFRTNKNRQWTVPQIEGHIVEFCQDQNGSRFIQQRLELGDRLEQDIVVREVLPSIRRLRNDVFGNYVVQKLLDFGTPQVRSSIRDTLEGEMLQLSLQMYGCRVVQKALEALEEDDLTRLLAEFHHNVLSCIHDQNGNHVIQKCIEVFNSRAKAAAARGDFEVARRSQERIDFIINDVLVNATTLSCHPFGCRVLQRILEHCDDSRKNKLLDEAMKSHRRLLDDQYGNYVIQHVLQYGRVEDRDSILAIVVENGLLGLSRQKFASNVVEKLLKYGNGPQRKAIAREMLKTTNEASSVNLEGGDTSIVLLMVRDAYANYVVQTTLDVVPISEERTLLLNELNRHSEELRNYTFAKHIVAKLTALDDSNTSNPHVNT